MNMTKLERVVATWLFVRVVRGQRKLQEAMRILAQQAQIEFPEDNVATTCNYIRAAVDDVERFWPTTGTASSGA